MLTSITFLLAVPVEKFIVGSRESSREQKKKPGKKKSKKSGKKTDRSESKKKDKGKRSKSKEKPVKSLEPSSVEFVKEIPPVPPHVLNVGNPSVFVHIEYELIPKIVKYFADVVCWEKVFKVFTKHDAKALKTIISGNLVWLCFTIKHQVLNLDDFNLLKLHGHVVKYTIDLNKSKLGKKAAGEKTVTFYQHNQDIDNNNFVVVYEKDPNVTEINVRTEFHQINDNVSVLCALPGVTHRHKVLDIIDKTAQSKLVKTVFPNLGNRFPSTESPPKEEVKVKKGKAKKQKKTTKTPKKKKGKKGKKSKEGKAREKKVSLFELPVAGELLFTDPQIFVCGTTAEADVTKTYIMTSVKSLMTSRQCNALNPLLIKLEVLKNLPTEILAENNYSSICAVYNFPGIESCTGVFPVDRKVHFADHRAHFTMDCDHLQLLENIQSSYILVEIWGLREPKELKPAPALFESRDRYINDRLTKATEMDFEDYQRRNSFPAKVLLAVAKIDLADLQPPLSLKMYCTVHHPDNAFCKSINRKTISFDRSINVNEIHLSPHAERSSFSPLSEDILLSHNVQLKVEVQLMNNLNKQLLKLLSSNSTFNRLLLVLTDWDIASDLLNDLLVYNQTLLGHYAGPPNFCQPTKYVTEFQKEKLRPSLDFTVSTSPSEYIMTGFMIDNGVSFIFFIEGLSNGLIQTIWHQLMNLESSGGNIFFHSDTVFEQRIYEDFITFGGIYLITLQQPLHHLFKQEKTYLKPYMPLPCWKAVTKLDLLLKTKTITKLNKLNLFPTSRELLSLDIEWGIPLHWKDYRDKVAKRRTVASIMDKIID